MFLREISSAFFSILKLLSRLYCLKHLALNYKIENIQFTYNDCTSYKLFELDIGLYIAISSSSYGSIVVK